MHHTDFTRYAAYFTAPPGSAWAEFGASWLGWDVDTGTERAHPDMPSLARPVAEITATPRKYGFHATIKPPLRLAEGEDYAALEAATEALAPEIAPVVLEGLQVSALRHFVALTPLGDVTALNAMAASFVTGLDRFRAPAGEAELARRRKSGLSVPQEALLLKWGYPYVLDEFHFHMTLSGRLPEDEAEALRQALAPTVSEILGGPVTLDAISLAGEGADGRFRLIRRIPFTG